MRSFDMVLLLIFIANGFSMFFKRIIAASFIFLLICDAHADQSINLFSPDGRMGVGLICVIRVILRTLLLIKEKL
jgi:hypothetical protein